MRPLHIHKNGFRGPHLAIDEDAFNHKADQGFVTVDAFERKADGMWTQTNRFIIRREFLVSTSMTVP